MTDQAGSVAGPGSVGPPGAPPGTQPEEELTIPRASMNKMIKEVLPDVRVAHDARELVLACCTEFIRMVSSEANDICNNLQKKTISPEHVLAALDSLGFGDYRIEAEAVLKDCKQVAKQRRRGSTRLENLGIPEAELLRQQQELFAQAKEEQAQVDQQEWMRMQQEAQLAAMMQQQQQQVLGQANSDDHYG
ncbi:PREDICTED: protein Dr1-like [Priapulus caudatus]|uniref:Protein Dr1 n=1 Tax=Priapulus caudatus TaxID=37621 RepID=A0ABM1EHF0_PRICU|nr:PREDICTED: protein Dr1-like [Priapulus caudatus]XP_014671698.1 PREDICTED: protein Dr1-like [Priapulus caudatus]XP_014671776.1 PREDICTED: protein Dr1-like [Priapulus caudatus]